MRTAARFSVAEDNILVSFFFQGQEEVRTRRFERLWDVFRERRDEKRRSHSYGHRNKF